MAEYWDRYWTRRKSRRRLLGGALALGAGGAGLVLVGCGDDDDDGGTSSLATATPASDATATPNDPFANAVRGGTYKPSSLYTAGDPPTIDPYGNLSYLTKHFASFVYSRLFKYQAGPVASQVRPVPDLAESVETSADGLTWTVTMKTDVKFHNVAPVSGRAVTTDDVKYSWARATDKANTNAAQLAFVEKAEFPDVKTIVFTLKTPNAAFKDVLADSNLLWVMPTEADGGFDPTKTAIGSGPWIFESYTPSVALRFKRNPEWYETGFPLMDAVEEAIVPEYATRLAQFRAGNSDTCDLAGADLPDVKKQMADVVLAGNVPNQLSYLYFDSDPASPWNKDERVRQAISMSLDRDGLTDLGYEISKLKNAGVDARGPWNNIIPAGMTRWWLDPQSSAAGESGKFFKYDPAEAKKLLSAAGYADGFTVAYQYTANRYGKSFNDIAEAQVDMMRQIGIKTETEVQDYASKYITQTFIGNFKGIAFGRQTPFSEGGGYPMRLFTDNPLNNGRVKDPQLTKLAMDQQVEMDEAKRKEIFAEIQRYNASKMYYVPSQDGSGTAWAGIQSWMRNQLEFQTSGYGHATETYPFHWKAKS